MLTSFTIVVVFVLVSMLLLTEANFMERNCTSEEPEIIM